MVGLGNSWSGRETLQSLDSALRQVRADVQAADLQIQSVSQAQVGLRGREAELYRELARIRLDAVVSGDIANGLDAAGRLVRELLEQRRQALADLQDELDSVQQDQAGLEQERVTAAAALGGAAEHLDQGEAEVQETLAQDGAYKAQLARTQKTDNIASHAEEKTALAEADREQKGRPYTDEPLFMYLWKRGYATPAYAAGPLIRYLDNWVAGLCAYRAARPNYHMLLEIPQRLREHAERLREVADGEFGALEVLEQQAARAGGIPALQQQVQAAEQQLAHLDEAIDQAEQQARRLLQARAAFAGGEDPYYVEAIAALAGALEKENLSALYRHVMATPNPRDDLLVQELLDIDLESKRHASELRAHKKIYEKHLARLRELEQVRQRFKHERYDDVRSVFKNTDMVGMLLQEFLHGLASSSDLWKVLQRSQGYRRGNANPGFGTGGLRLPRTGSWRSPFPRGGGGPGGGFRTGGGI